ncbi:glycan biosynthesis hexose transferase WsfD [Cellulosimicrobium protaetiae]
MSTPQTQDVAAEPARRPDHRSFDQAVLQTARRTPPPSAGRQHARRPAWSAAGALRGRPRALTVLLAAVLSVLGAVRVLVPTAIGLADSGEGRTVACSLGIEPTGGGPRYFSFSILDWSAATEPCAGTPTLHSALLHVAGWLSPGAALDLRVTALAWCVLAGAAAAVVGHLARGRRFGRTVATGLTWVVLLDTAFVGYSASLYPQALALAGLVLCLVGWLLLDDAGALRWVGWAAVLGGGASLVVAGPVTATAAVPLVGLLVWRAVREGRASAWRVTSWVVPAAVAVALLAPAVVGATSATADQRKNNVWEMVSVGLLADADDPEAELEDMGLPRETERFVGVGIWSPSSIRGWSGWPGLELGQGEVLRYLATHPGAAYDRLEASVDGVAAGLPAGLGSYTAESSEPAGAQEGRLTLFSSFQGSFLGLGAPVALLAWGFLLWVALAAWRTHGPRDEGRRLAEAALLALCVAATQVLAVALTEATDVARHVVVGSLAGGLALCLVVASGLTLRGETGTGADPGTEAEPEATTTATATSAPEAAPVAGSGR